MRNLYLTILTLVLFFCSNAQILRELTSPETISSRVPGYSEITSINTTTISYTPPIINDPSEDDTTERTKIYFFGSRLPVNIVLSAGNITTTTEGKVWTIRINVPNALNVGLLFSQFNLSSSAEMYIYNDAKTTLNYEIKKDHFVNSDTLLISSMNGNAVIVHILERNNFGSFQSTISITQVIAGYKEIQDVGTFDSPTNARTTYCIPDVRCFPSHMPLARAVCRVFGPFNGIDMGLGTATLINNEQNNGRAYLLTAFHVVDFNGNGILDQNEAEIIRTQVSFQFQFWRTSCNSYTNNSFIEFTGAVLRASNLASDMALLELINPPGIGDLVNYAGWSRQTSAPSDGGSYVIHHPESKNMRHSTTITVNNDFWRSNFWSVQYNEGTALPGSSGAALFNQNNQIVGQLWGGRSNCFWRGHDIYGKFYKSWNDGGLQQWLSTVQGLQSIGTLDLTNISFTGPSEISSCTSPTGQYSTIPSLLDVTYTWTVSSGLQISSGQGTPNVTISALPTNQSTTETITLTLASPTKGRIRTFTVSRNITVYGGAPTASCDIIGAGNCLEQIYLCASELDNWQYVNIPGPWGENATGYHIEAQDGAYFNGGATEMDITNFWFSVYAPSQGPYSSTTVTVRAMNGCGVSSDPYIIAFIEKDPYECGYYFYSVAPNPVQSTMTVSIRKGVTGAAHTSFDQINIYDQQGNLKLTRKLGKVKSSSINVSNLTNGIYIIEIIDGTYREKQKLIIQK